MIMMMMMELTVVRKGDRQADRHDCLKRIPPINKA